MSIDMEAADFFAVGVRYAGAEQVVGPTLARGLDRITIAGADLAKEEVGVRTGDLRTSLTHKPATFGGGVARGSYGTDMPYARYHEEGRGPVVARGRALRFTIGGQTIYRKRVGPAAGRWYMRKSKQRLEPIIVRESQQMGVEIIAGLVGSS